MSDLADLVITSVAMVSIGLVSIVGNMLIIVAVLWNKRIQTIGNILFVNLAVADFFQGAVSIPLRLAEQLNPTSTRPLIPCLAVIPLTIFFYSASNLNITIISVDRFVALYKPMKYKNIVTTRSVATVITVSWSAALLISLVPIMGWGPKENLYLIDICLFSTTLEKEYLFVLFSFINLAVLLVLGVTNIFILKTARNQIRRIHVAKLPALEVNTVNTDSTSTANQTVDTSGSKKSKVSFSSFRRRAHAKKINVACGERKATKVVLIIVGLFVVLTVPITIIDLLGVFEVNVTIPLIVIKIAACMAYSNACFNVFIYAGYNKEMRDTLRLMYVEFKRYCCHHPSIPRKPAETSVNPGHLPR